MKKAIAIGIMGTLLISCSHEKAKEKKETAQADQLTDAQVSRIVTTANDGEVLLAQYVIENSKNVRVKEFATHMLDDHTLNNTLTREIASEEKFALGDSPKSEELEQKMTQNSLMGLKGRELDVAYMDDQVKTHETVLNDLNNTLIPETQDPELKAHLLQTTEKVQMHLDHAREIRQTL